MKIRTYIAPLAAVAAAVLLFAACSAKEEETIVTDPQTQSTTEETQPETTEALELSISTDTAYLEIGQAAVLTLSASNEIPRQEVEWSSSEPEVLSVEDGKVTGLKTGKATIQAAYDGTQSNEVELQCVIYAESIALNETEIAVQLGGSKALNATVLPENATFKTVTWASKNSETATVTSEGKVTGKAVGKTTITATDSRGKIVAECAVTVNPIPVEQVKIDDSKVKIGTGQKYPLTASCSPDSATEKSVTWKSSDESVLTVSGSGVVTAKKAGSATVTATADNGGVKASCEFTVGTSDVVVKTMYASNAVNVRSGASTSHKVVEQVGKSAELKILKDGTRSKVSTKSGNVGYVLTSNLSSTKPVYISGVPYLNQFSLGYPTGCEAVSATMVLKYYGYNVSAKNVVDATPTDTKGKYQKDGVWYGADPFEYFVGHPSKQRGAGSYGCFAKPIVTAMQKYAGGRVKNISGCSSDTLFSYVAKGQPVVVWCVRDAKDLTKGVTWKYPDGSGSYEELVGQHCAVLIGYDENYVYLNDPSAGKDAKQSKAKFLKLWKQLYSQAIVIE